MTAQSRSRESSRSRPAAEDDLPPFSDLTNDEDRERKAETQDPGTFHVVVNPESFSDLPEYRDNAEAVTEAGLSEVAAGKRPATWPASGDGEQMVDGTLPTEDPNVVILRHFEDPGRRPSFPGLFKTSASSPTTASFSPTTLAPNLDQLTVSIEAVGRRPSIEIDQLRVADAKLIENYRKTISPLLMWNNETYPDGDLFEQESKTFLPVCGTHLRR